MRRPALLAALVGALALVLRRRRAGHTDKDVWTQATAAPDLR